MKKLLICNKILMKQILKL